MEGRKEEGKGREGKKAGEACRNRGCPVSSRDSGRTVGRRVPGEVITQGWV